MPRRSLCATDRWRRLESTSPSRRDSSTARLLLLTALLCLSFALPSAQVAMGASHPPIRPLVVKGPASPAASPANASFRPDDRPMTACPSGAPPCVVANVTVGSSPIGVAYDSSTWPSLS
jgi:hypothetical protein